MDSVALFCEIDAFCLHFEPRWRQPCLAVRSRQWQRQSRLALSEVRTIEGAFQRTVVVCAARS